MIGEFVEGKEGGEGEGVDLDNFEDNVVFWFLFVFKRYNKLCGCWFGIEVGLYFIGRRDMYLVMSKVLSFWRFLILLGKWLIL